MCVRDNPDPFNGTKPSKFSFKVLRFNFIAQMRNEQSLESIASDLGVFCGFIPLNTFSEKLSLLLFFLESDPVAALEPTLRRHVAIIVFVFPERLEELSDSTNSVSFALLGRMVRRRNVTEGGTGCEKGEEIWWEFVRHDRRRTCRSKKRNKEETQVGIR